jgi:hypothetical protein
VPTGSSATRHVALSAHTAERRRRADPKKSRALYAVSSDVEGVKIAAGAVTRVNNEIVGLLQSAPEVLTTDLQLIATMLQSIIAGVKRQLLESDLPEAQFEVMQRELMLVVRSYVRACVGR